MEYSSKIGLGSAQFGMSYGISNIKGQTPSEEVSLILKTAENVGINIIDTAQVYGDAEEIIGKNNLDNFKVISKFIFKDKNEKILNQLKSSLEKLNISSLHGYLSHHPLDLIQNPLLWEELKELKKSSLISKIGFSLNSPDELDLLLNKKMIPDLIQTPFNYFDRRFTSQLTYLKSIGCEIHTRSVFLQGLFFKNTTSLPSFFDEVSPLIKRLQDNYEHLASSLLIFALKQTFIDKVIIGVESNLQLLQNLNFLDRTTQLPDISYQIPDRILMPSRWPNN